MTSNNESALGYYPDSELVFGIVTPIGIDYHPFVTSLVNYLEQFGYTSKQIKISDRFEELAKLLQVEIEQSEYSGQQAHMWRKIQLGDAICRKTNQKDIHALLATAIIEKDRTRDVNPKVNLSSPRTAHIIVSLKRPQEVATLRSIYGPGFFLIGIAAKNGDRESYFEERGFGLEERIKFVETDAAEKGEYGQKTRDTFYLSDVFISLEDTSQQVGRFLDLVFGSPFKTPNFEERSMYLAYSASLSSGDLARQVGSALMDKRGDCLGLGWNDVPKAGGGLYGPETGSHRDIEEGEDSNDREKLDMAAAIIHALDPKTSKEDARLEAKNRLAGTGFFDITEFGRAVHAEMAAILACARTGRTPQAATLFVTTFPCHNCTRHIIASGIERVYYIEPYTKSKALKLHGDACTESSEDAGKIPFLPFIGIGPRRFLDLFSMSLGTGYPVERKKDGKVVDWNRQTAAPRLQMAPVAYLVREQLALISLQHLLTSSK